MKIVDPAQELGQALRRADSPQRSVVPLATPEALSRLTENRIDCRR
ncbi:hypothetical protein G5B40_09035 [Pikeienuella piscinae]|uniref:Uncharacterized protein n=1 Tax=Pikeienuella piscinae TaxID=2748098 RepID=A0A7L5BYJ5_9RHOB|nr:hypothetical protein [Pikeienuella piscinae]QIE55587.1 hypothetical protein G5B40_09035 [Pikeienuella piscinae]